jgi:methylase of polypeptide subunit release factors
LLYALLSQKYRDIDVLGIDISDTALRLARDNLQHNVKEGLLAQPALEQVSFVKADILSDDIGRHWGTNSTWDIVISNPPYISEAGFNKDANRSVRNWEPKLALVPPIIENDGALPSHTEDIFYNKILDITRAGGARLLLMEVGDLQQALRVAQLALDTKLWSLVEVWRDWPDQKADQSIEAQEAVVGDELIQIRGSGHGRSVFCWR